MHAPCAASQILGAIPAGMFVLTAAHDERRSGTLVRWVQQCAEDPPMVMVALRKGHSIEPLIRDSRAFALCLLEPNDVLLRRIFDMQRPHGDDPFVSLPTSCAPSGSPVLLRALGWADCELVRHIDIESDYELYIGLVRHARARAEPGGAHHGGAAGTNGRPEAPRSMRRFA